MGSTWTATGLHTVRRAPFLRGGYQTGADHCTRALQIADQAITLAGTAGPHHSAA